MKQVQQFAAAVSTIKKVTGYADSVGTADYNFTLSMKRAASVVDILKESVSRKLIDYKGESVIRSSELSKNRVVQIDGYVSANQITDIFDIENIWFLPDKPIITPESLPNIQILAKRLGRYQDAYFELIGHVNYESKRPSSVLNSMFKLSQERARVIKDLLIENGVSSAKIISRGVGNSQPIYPQPANDEERKKNMRVQVIVYRIKVVE